MKITESEKNRIRGLHRQNSIIKEDWGSKKDEYKRTDGHRDGDVDGHYKAYEGVDTRFDEDEGDVIGAEWQADSDLDKDNIDVTEADIALTEDTEGEETYHYGEDEGEDHDEEMDLEHDEDMAPHDRIDAIEKHLDALKKDMSYDEDHEDRGEEGDDFE